MMNIITITAERYAELCIAEHEAKILKELLNKRAYLGIDGKELALICEALSMKEEG